MDVFDHYAMALRLAYKAGAQTQHGVDDWCDIEENATYEERVSAILTTVATYVTEVRQERESYVAEVLREQEHQAACLHELQVGAEELLAAMKGDG